jgi:predicted CopG family antitoxin
LATIEKQKEVYYLPKKNSFIFAGDDDNSSKLRIAGLKADVLYNEPIFFCADGTFESGKNISSFAKGDVYENPVKIHSLLRLEQKLFVPYSDEVDMSQYNVKIIDEVTERLFIRGLSNESVFAEIADVLEHLQQETRYFDIIAKKSRIDLTQSQVQVIASHKKMARSFTELSQKYIEGKKRTSVVFTGIWKKASKELCDTIEELVASADLDQIFEKYIAALKCRFLLLPGVKGDFHLAGNNGIVLSADSALGSFGELSKAFDPRKTFSATLQIRQASERLNAADESMSNAEYLKLLRGVRNSLIGAFGKKS